MNKKAEWTPEMAGRLRAAAKDYGKQEDLSSASGVPVTTLQKMLSGGVEPKISTLVAVVNELDVSLEHILTGEASPDPEDMIGVPFHDIAVSAGPGISAIDAGRSAESIGFPKPWLRRLFGEPTHLRVVHVKGDSMEPTLQDGGLLMFDVSRRDEVDGIFVLRLDDQLLVKRVGFPGGGKVLITSDNNLYERSDRLINLEKRDESEFALIGRGVWSGQKL